MAPQPDTARPGVVIVDGTTGIAVPTGGTAGTATFSTLANGGNAVSATNPEPVQLSQANAVASATNPVPVQLSQANAAIGNSNPIPIQIVANGSVNQTTNPVATSMGYRNNQDTSKGAGAAAPGAGSAFVSLAANALAAGTWLITVVYSISGAAEVASNGANVRLSDASGGFTSIDMPSNNGGTAGVQFGPFSYLVPVGAANTVKLTAVAAATASTVYAGTITARQIA